MMNRTICLLDNTLLTGASRALRPRETPNDLDLMALVELTQSLLCYEEIRFDASSRRTEKEQSSFREATLDWEILRNRGSGGTFFQEIQLFDEAGVNYYDLIDSAARIALQEAADGRFTKPYKNLCKKLGVPNLLPPWYTSDKGPDDVIFSNAEKELRKLDRKVDLSHLDKAKEARPLARYVFRGYVYFMLATLNEMTYVPSTLRGKLLRETLLLSDPCVELEERQKRVTERLDLLERAGLSKGLLADIVQIPGEFKTGVGSPLLFPLVVRTAREKGLKIPEAIVTLRRNSHLSAFRGKLAHIVTLLTSGNRDAEKKAMSEAITLGKYKELYDLVQGDRMANLSLLPFMSFVSTGGKLVSDVGKQVPAVAASAFSIPLSGVLFTPLWKRPHIAALWEMLETRKDFSTCRKALDEYKISNPGSHQ